MPDQFCVYEHWRPDKGACFYVGKGTIKRARQVSRRDNLHHSRIVEKLKNLGMQVEVRIIESSLSESEAFSKEIELIAFWRNHGDGLSNQTNGGDGASGRICSAEHRAKISGSLRGKPKPSLEGRSLTFEHRAKISAALKNRVVSDETKKKISDAQKGKPRPELIGRRISEEGMERLRNRVFTKEHRAKISAAKKGMPLSAEHKAALAASRIPREERN